MKTIWALGDRGEWAQSLQLAGGKRGWDVRLFGVESIPDDEHGYVFMRFDPDAKQLAAERAVFEQLHARGWHTVPDIRTARCYEDKFAQALRYARYMPRTLLLTGPNAARLAVWELGFPFVSKSSSGAGSANVRLIADQAQAEAEIEAVFGPGLPLPCAWAEPTQRGYLIWQEFVPGNAGDYRVIVTGRYRMLLRRRNRVDAPFASGSGHSSAVAALNDEASAVLAKADEFFRAENLRWCGIDLVRDPRSGEWKILETTCAWTLPGYRHCVYFDEKNRPTRFRGKHIWKVLFKEIEAGVFDRPH